MRQVGIVTVKAERIGAWIEREWMTAHPEQDWLILGSDTAVRDKTALAQLDREMDFGCGFHFAGTKAEACAEFPRMTTQYGQQVGAYRYLFNNEATSEQFEVLVIMHFHDEYVFEYVTVAAVPQAYINVWQRFADECIRLYSRMHAGQRVYVIGGRLASFAPTVKWEDIILDETVKDDVLKDVQKFYQRGVHIYRKLNLKPFRKLLFAGVPGTGKTMLCTGLAKWALEQGYLVIYVSSADCNGANFAKIEQALSIAANAECPTLILLEEIDAYLHKQQKAMVLNVLDGNESQMNRHGTLLIATTNYPEAIDERVLKRPGRLDRIIIVPPLTSVDEAERMLKLYLGSEWRNGHRIVAAELVGFTGAFVREMSIYALTQFADLEMTELSAELLMQSFQAFKSQIDARDDFMKGEAASETDEDDSDSCNLPYRPMANDSFATVSSTYNANGQDN
jgi:DNA polymerase III delta prime subunit